MNRMEARIIVAGLLPDGMKPHRLTARGRQEVRDAIDLVLAMASQGAAVSTEQAAIQDTTHKA